MRDVRPTVENHRCVSRLSLRNAPILPCPFTPNTTRSSQFSLPEAHSVHAAFFSSRPFLPYPPRRIQCPVRFRCALPSLPSRRFIRGGLVLFTLPCALRPAHPVLFSHARRFALFLPSASPVIVVVPPSVPFLPSLSFPSHSLIPCAILLIPLSFPPQTLIPCAFTLIPLSFSHSVRLHSHSPLILSFRAPSLSFPSHSLIPCAFTLIPLSFSHSVRLHSHSPLILSFRAPSLSFPSHSPLILSFRAPSLSFPSHSLFPCAFALIPLSVSHSVRHPSQSLFPCAFTLIPLSFSHSVRHPSHSPLILSFRASSLSFPSHSLIPCAFTLLPLSFSLRVCLPSHSPLNLSFRAPSLSFPSHSLIPCAFTRIPLYSSSHVRVLIVPLWFTPHVRDLSLCPIPLCSAPPVRMLPLSPLRLSAHAQFVFFPSAPLPPLRLLARSPLSLFSSAPSLSSLCFSSSVHSFSCSRFAPSLSRTLVLAMLHTSDTSSSSDSVDSVQPFEQDDDASSNAAVSGADDDGGEGAQAGVALAEEEDAPQFNLKDALARRILSNRLSISQINALLEILHPQYVGNVRVYSNPETGLWWERLQTLVREEDPDGVVAALILASDETHMDHRGKAKGHPVYLTLGNIDKDDRWQPSGHVLLALLPEFLAEYNVVDKMQVHNYIMREVLQSLKTASYTGMAMKNAVGESINVWPYLWLEPKMDALVSYIEWYLECARASEHTDTSLLEFKTKAQPLGDDILTEENKRRQLAKEAALKTAAVNTLHGAPTVGKTAAAGRRGGSKRKRAAAGSVVIEAAEEGGVDPSSRTASKLVATTKTGTTTIADDVDGVQAGNDDELRAVEVRAAEVCAAKVRAVEVRAAELRAAELRAAELRAAEIRGGGDSSGGDSGCGGSRAVEDRAAAVRAADVRSCGGSPDGAGAAHLAA
ncbi:unnamed protein product [Closterium sp. NIES-65]|nr:unnamed protein product [Closterium sp. NIES-65]